MAQSQQRSSSDCSSTSTSRFCVNFIIGGLATSGACIGSNPMEVVKTRMQLMGELEPGANPLKPKVYKNAFHAAYTIARVEGIRGLQRGLVTGMIYQIFMNGTRLSLYEPFQGLYGGEEGKGGGIRSNIAAGASAGMCGAMIGSPFFLIKARIQAAVANTKPTKTMMINSQYHYRNMFDGFAQILKTDGWRGLYRGVEGAIPRVAVGSAAQLASYSWAKTLVQETLDSNLDHNSNSNSNSTPNNNKPNSNSNSILVHVLASLVSGLVVTTAMNPFDVVSTRLYSQKVVNGQGVLYRNVVDCFLKTFRAEGVVGLFKGWAAHYLRLGPHTILTFVFWEQLKRVAEEYELR